MAGFLHGVEVLEIDAGQVNGSGDAGRAAGLCITF